MKIAIYPGSFNPWHRGHESILEQACKLFDKVVVAKGVNPDKATPSISENISLKYSQPDNAEIVDFSCLLKDLVIQQQACAIIKGIRNIQDFEYEKTQQYWNEDLGIEVPTIYIIAKRDLVHISSSAIRMLDKFKK